jgi:1,2-dihydroxy-3-keto-5-methylthiopentene dioxygenase
MARITIPDEGRRIEAFPEVSGFLAGVGIQYERWDVGDRVSADASSDDILAAYAPEIERLKKQGGYLTADVISVTPETPGLEGMLARFSQEHTHSEDEVRFIVKGRGLFHIHPADAPVFALELEAGDLIRVPAGTRHWFDLCSDRTIRAIRLFQDASGWTPHYTSSGLQARYEPVCLGPAYLPLQSGRPPATLDAR